MQHFFISSADGDIAYPIATFANDKWSISNSFSPDEFAEWLEDQGSSELEAWIADKVIQQYTGNCPGCDEAIAFFPDDNDEGRDIMNYECSNCGVSGEIEMVEPGDE